MSFYEAAGVVKRCRMPSGAVKRRKILIRPRSGHLIYRTELYSFMRFNVSSTIVRNSIHNQFMNICNISHEAETSTQKPSTRVVRMTINYTQCNWHISKNAEISNPKSGSEKSILSQWSQILKDKGVEVRIFLRERTQ